MFDTYHTERLILKTLSQDAASMVLSFYEDNKEYFEPWEPQRSKSFYTMSYQKASLSAESVQMSEGKLLRLWVFLKDNPYEIIGTLCFQNLLKDPYCSCSLGYKFSHRHLHCGYATESLRKGLEIIFQDYRMHRVEAFILPNNLPSLQLIDRMDFDFEGISYSFARIGGEWVDHMRYSVINPKDIRK